MVRAKLLVLAGVQAQSMGLDAISALCRHQILAQNPRHLVRKWPTIGDALATEAFKAHLKQLRRRYSPEKVEHMVHSLGIEMGQERAAYFTDMEYAAALLNTRVDAIPDVLASDPTRRTEKATATNGAARPSGSSGEHSHRPRPTARNLLIVWGPFVAGLVGLAALAVASGTLGR